MPDLNISNHLGNHARAVRGYDQINRESSGRGDPGEKSADGSRQHHPSEDGDDGEGSSERRCIRIHAGGQHNIHPLTKCAFKIQQGPKSLI